MPEKKVTPSVPHTPGKPQTVNPGGDPGKVGTQKPETFKPTPGGTKPTESNPSVPSTPSKS